MSSENIIEEQKAANLARIRDNQRRSRARRKEYLQELEERYRVCEQLGVEASAEMQAAARRVIEENRYLRTMLKQHGYTDIDIDRAVQEGPSAMPAVANLEALFGKRRHPNLKHDSSSSQMNNSSECSTQPTPSSSAVRQLHAADQSQINHMFPSPYQNSAMNVAIPVPSSSTASHHGLVFGDDQSQWSGDYYASHEIVPGSSRTGHHHEGIPSIQSIKSEVGYGPQEEMDCQSTDADYTITDDQAFEMSKRYPR